MGSSVFNDEDFLLRNAFEEWSNKINKLQGNIRDLPGSEASRYKAQAQVTQLSKTGQKLRVYQFNGVWPSQIAPIPLDWGSQDTIEEFSITLEYDWFEIVDGSTGNAGGA